MKKTILLTLILMITAFGVAACGGGDEPAAEVDSSQAAIEVIMNDIYFGESNDNVDNPPVWTVKTGQTVAVNTVNNGSLDHNWAIVEAGATLPDTVSDPAQVEDLITYDVGVVAGGDAYNGVFRAPVPGEYRVICTVAGHYPAMQGTLIVEE